MKEEIHKLRQSGLHRLSAAIRLMSEENKARGSIITTVVEPLWAFGADRVQRKVTPYDNVVWSASWASSWQQVLVDLVSNATADWKAMQYMGILESVEDEDGLAAQDHLCGLVFDFLVALLEAKAWSYGVTHWTPPHSFAALLPLSEQRQDAAEAALRQWKTVLSAELRASALPTWGKFMNSIHFLQWPVVWAQAAFRC